MVLRSFHIRNYRSLTDLQVTGLGQMNVFIGRNNAGKTSILRALHTALSLLRSHVCIGLTWSDQQEVEAQEFSTTVEFEVPSGHNWPLTLASKNPERVSFTVKHSSGALSFVSNVVFDDISVFDLSEQEARQLDDLKHRLTAIDQMQPQLANIIGRANPVTYLALAHEVQALDLGEAINQQIAQAVSSNNFQLVVNTLNAANSSLSKELNEGNTELTTKKKAIKANTEISINQVEALQHSLFACSYRYLTERRDLLSTDDARELAKIKMNRNARSEWSRLTTVIHSLLGERLDVYTEGNGATIEVGSTPENVNGSGTREVSRMLLDLEIKTPALAFLEEPETHSHPGLVSSLGHYLAALSDRTQTLITTHSPSFMSASNASGARIFSVSKGRSGGTAVVAADLDEDLFRISKDLGMTPASLFMFDRLLLVEGTSDETILREFALKLGIDFAKVNLGIFPMGGVTLLTHFASGKLLSYLHRHSIPTTFIIDRDENSASEIADMQQRIGDKADLRVLKRRELENYLISPNPMIRWIKETIGEDISKGDLDKALDSAVEELASEAKRLRVRRKLAKPIYFDSKGEASFSAVLNKGKDEIDRRLDMLSTVESEVAQAMKSEAPLDSYPGSMLLELALKKLGKRFSKGEGDSARLARVFREHEIPEELKRFLEH